MIDAEKTRIDEQVIRYKKVIEKKRVAIESEMKKLRKIIEDNKAILDENVLSELLLNLRYLVKVDSFKEEQDCRIIDFVKSSDNRVKDARVVNNFMYIPYLHLKDHINRITFGPKAEGFNLFKNRFLSEGFTDINCRKSEHSIS